MSAPDRPEAPCPNPWCSSHGDDAVPEREDVWQHPALSPLYRVQCPYCPVKGPTADNEAEAITAWNTRPTPDTRPAAAGSVREAAVAAAVRRLERKAVPEMGQSTICDRADLRIVLDALAAAPTPDAAASSQSDGDPDGWLAVKVNGEGGIVMPYGPLHPGPDRPADPRYQWAPFHLGEPV